MNIAKFSEALADELDPLDWNCTGPDDVPEATKAVAVEKIKAVRARIRAAEIEKA